MGIPGSPFCSMIYIFLISSKIFWSVRKAWRHITPIIPIIVMTMPTVPTPRDHFIAHVIMATREMVLYVQVKKLSYVGKIRFYTMGGSDPNNLYINLFFFLVD